MKRSIGVFAHPASCTSGASGRSTRSKAQWPRYSAPSVIHRRKISASCGVIGLFTRGGGITTSGSVLVIRAMISLFAGSPGTTAVVPLSSSAIAASRTSSRRPACLSSASGPWQEKHRSERIGRTSRLKSRPASAARADEALSRAEIATTIAPPCAVVRPMNGSKGNTRVAVRRPLLSRGRPSNADPNTGLGSIGGNTQTVARSPGAAKPAAPGLMRRFPAESRRILRRYFAVFSRSTSASRAFTRSSSC